MRSFRHLCSVNNRFRAFFFFDFVGIGIFFPYLALHLNQIGLSGGQVGLVLGIIPLVGFLVQPLWGMASDIYNLRRSALVLGCFGASIGAVLFALTTDFLLLFLLAVFIAIMKGPIMPVGTALALDHLDDNGNKATFGSLRLWGSIGFSAAAFSVGSWIIEDGVWRIIPLYALTMFVLGLTSLALPDAEVRAAVNWRQGFNLLKNEHTLRRFLLGCLLIGATLGVVNNYMAVYLDDIRTPGWLIGIALALSALPEVPLMAQAQSYLRRWGMRIVLVGGVAVLPGRWLLYTFIEEPWLVIPTQLLHSIAMMSLLVVGVLYVDRMLARRWRATGQALYAAVLHGIGPTLGLFAAGLIYERAGISPVWMMSALVALAGVVLLDMTVREPARREVRQEASS